MKTPHKHAELIKAWADGALIEYWSKTTKQWTDVEAVNPYWKETTEYRIKPKPKPDIVYYGVFDEGQVKSQKKIIDSCFTSLADQGDQIKLTFDGETGKLKSAEVL